MGASEALELGRNTIITGLMLCAPMLIAGLVVGLTTSIFLAATQIQEFTLTFIPKMVIMALAAFVFGPWMLKLLIDFTARILTRVAQVGH
jgi:flagellar biosynthesis protein FliQ